MFKGKKVLVTGGAGFIGTNLIIRLLELGADVRASLHEKPAQIEDDRVEFMQVDLTNAADCAKLVKNCDYVFMCAANTFGAGVMSTQPMRLVTPNVLMNTLILEAAYAADIKKFLYISSNAVYPLLDHPITEDEFMAGEVFEKYYPVAWMKRFSEIMCRMYAEKIAKPMPVAVVRPVNVYGPYDDFEWETSHVIPALIRKVVEGHDPLEVWGDGRDLKDFIYIDDLIDGLLLAMAYQGEFQPFNLASATGTTIRELLAYLLEIGDHSQAQVVYNSDKPSMIPKRILSIDLANAKLGFKPKVGLQEGLQRTMQWYQQQGQSS